MSSTVEPPLDPALAVAVIGMAGRFPGAADIDAYWANLRAGRDSVVRFDGLSRPPPFPVGEPAAADARGARGMLVGIDEFDERFFGFSPRDAQLMDPQLRLFLEESWKALEHSGYGDPARRPRTGVYAASGLSTYLLNNVLPATEAHGSDWTAIQTLNDKDYVATRAAYALAATGPAVAVQTACSSSLVAVHVAAQAVLTGECDLALAGGAAVYVPQDGVDVHRPGGIVAADGFCRPFDADATGTVFGNGVAAVVLRRLDGAIEAGDTVHAVIRGSAVSNDGAGKLGYLAPSVKGQVAAIEEAVALAGVDAASISYVEAHGTGTALGDPVEVSALAEAWRRRGGEGSRCLLGSAKANVGHLGEAAGVAGLIKVVCAVRDGELAPSLHYATPNPEIDFDATPFRVCTEAQPWPDDRRRAGVSSFGIGGTNCHVVLEQPPRAPRRLARAEPQLLLLSARTEPAAEAARDRLASWLSTHPDAALRDVAATLRLGRRPFSWRTAVVAESVAEAAQAVFAAGVDDSERRVSFAFAFPGQGSQRAGMGRSVYERYDVFRARFDALADAFRPLLDVDLRSAMLGEGGAEKLAGTAAAQAALFSLGVALAALLRAAGVEPDVLVGHSSGEITAAAVAGVFDDDAAVKVVAARGRAMETAPRGAMLAVGASEDDAAALLESDLALAAVNAAKLVTLAGDEAAIARAEAFAAERGWATRRLATSHAFHTPAMGPAAAAFGEQLRAIPLRPPSIPIVSTLSGRLLEDAEACSPDYWARQLLGTVRFADAAETLVQRSERMLFFELGAGRTLAGLLGTQARGPLTQAFPVLAGRRGQTATGGGGVELRAVLEAFGGAWSAGAELAHDVVRPDPSARRIPLPTYPFERRRHWLGRPDEARAMAAAEAPQARVRPAEATLRAQERPGDEAPNGIELVIVDFWREVLGVEGVPPGASFYELGGHSLAAIELVEKLGRAFPLSHKLPLRELLALPTVSGMATCVRTRLAPGTTQR